MKKYLLIAVVVLSVSVWILGLRLSAVKNERNRYHANQTTLLDSIQNYRTQSGKQASSVQKLELTVSEIKAQRSDIIAICKDLRIKVRRLQAASTAASATIVNLRAQLRDTVLMRDSVGIIVSDSARSFIWSDHWISVAGIIQGDSVACRVESIDTIRQIIHRVPRKFLFIRWGTKAIRQEIVSSNPHTKIIYNEYISVRKQGGG